MARTQILVHRWEPRKWISALFPRRTSPKVKLPLWSRLSKGCHVWFIDFVPHPKAVGPGSILGRNQGSNKGAAYARVSTDGSTFWWTGIRRRNPQTAPSPNYLFSNLRLKALHEQQSREKGLRPIFLTVSPLTRAPLHCSSPTKPKIQVVRSTSRDFRGL